MADADTTTTAEVVTEAVAAAVSFTVSEFELVVEDE